MARPDATPAFIAAASSPYTKPALFVTVTMLSGPVNIWSGVGTQVWNGVAYQGVGQFGTVSTIEEGSDIQARGITLTLSGIDATLIGDIISDYRQGLPVLVYLGLFVGGQLVQNPICCWSGRTDQPTLTVSGSEATLTIASESRLLEMNTGVERRYTSEDQQIDYPGDLGFSFVDSIQNKTFYWGRVPTGVNTNPYAG